ncbi:MULTISPECIES: hypothetical protein [Spirulina sp. CCY15215]|uniref:hypothetical protein n=1 Tax=Spirulina sp. CCY15215 TaxID=2767591 RepID=UPI0019513764|nr:hypothetical protein [Spirulina major]
MSVSSSSQDSRAFPVDLIRFSSRVEAERALRKSARKFTRPSWHVEQALYEGEYYGAQLTPLRKRDLKALAKIFEQDDIEIIHEDICTALKLLWPEPVWGDDPLDIFDESSLDFLAEFL